MGKAVDSLGYHNGVGIVSDGAVEFLNKLDRLEVIVAALGVGVPLALLMVVVKIKA